MRSNRFRTTAFAATALLAALSLTACSGDDGTAGAAAPGTGTTGGQSRATDTATGTGTGGKPADNAPRPTARPASVDSQGSTPNTGSGTGSGSDSGKGGSTTGSSRPATAACIGENTEITLTKVSRPINHLLLTMTNTGARACNAYHAPKLRFDDAQAVFPILDDSRPQAVVTLAPGSSAYAAILLTGDVETNDQYKDTRLAVHFSAKDPSGDTGTAPDELTLPAGTYWDDKGFVTYWQSDMADALTY
ncbi:DUF4232 domain-containing protein [Streptomyces sp. NRRL B-24720]|uniref:DUF4232 domain-containing protein n=1 Tax=Streptomyces sp. NRRL B-24720 TaxID=1476876 RepID=UPI0004C94944|nr:DUF4232 domain-containing protein [Streptomyces sp. NRRL B-24720]